MSFCSNRHFFWLSQTEVLARFLASDLSHFSLQSLPILNSYLFLFVPFLDLFNSFSTQALMSQCFSYPPYSVVFCQPTFPFTRNETQLNLITTENIKKAENMTRGMLEAEQRIEGKMIEFKIASFSVCIFLT